MLQLGVDGVELLRLEFGVGGLVLESRAKVGSGEICVTKRELPNVM